MFIGVYITDGWVTTTPQTFVVDLLPLKAILHDLEHTFEGHLPCDRGEAQSRLV